MNINMTRLTDAIASDFKGLSRAELEGYADYMGVQYHPNIKDENLRSRILEKLGKDPIEMTGAGIVTPDTPPVGELTVAQLMALNLTPDGAWGGRRRMVTIVRPDSYKGNQPQPFNWGRYRVMVPWARPVSVAYPIFEIIKNAESKELYQVRDHGRDGTPKIINELSVNNRFRYTDMGDDPTTAHLPISQQDQFRQVAEMTEFFNGWDARKMMRLAQRLRLRYPPKSTFEDLRDIVLSSLGYDVDFMDFAA